MERAIERTEKRLKANEKDARARMAVLERLRACLDTGHRARNVDMSGEERRRVSDLHLITTKPVMYVVITSYSIHDTKLYEHWSRCCSQPVRLGRRPGKSPSRKRPRSRRPRCSQPTKRSRNNFV